MLLITYFDSLCIGLFLALLDTTIVATSLYNISADLHAFSTTVSWVALAYTVSTTGILLRLKHLPHHIGW